MNLGEQIAVLDGLSVIDPSKGVLYGGGSNYPDGGRWPLLPSSAGLAGMRKRAPVKSIPNAYATRGVISAGNGALFSGGASYPERNAIPLMPSSVGLAGMAAADRDLMSKSNVIDVKRVINASNGANMSGGSNYPEMNPIPLMTSSVGLSGVGVVDPSGGANYTGGSDYSPGMPLLVSSAGLAGLAAAAEKFAAGRGKKTRSVANGDMMQDARRKLWAVFSSLRGVVANPKETQANKQKAAQFMAALANKASGLK